MSKRITIDLEPGYDMLLSITAVGSLRYGELRAITWGLNTEKTTWITVCSDGKVREHGTEPPEEE